MPIFRRRSKKQLDRNQSVDSEHPEHEFRVVGNEIIVSFAVPLPATGADEVLTDLLRYHAIEIIKDRKSRGQPLDGIPVARISALREGEAHQVAVLELDVPVEQIEIEIPGLVPRPLVAGYDPLAKFGEKPVVGAMPMADRSSDELPPLGEELRLTSGVAAGLRSLGVDPDRMSASDLGVGLLRLSGYDVSDRGNGTYLAVGHGATTLVSIVDHVPGDHPELAEDAVTSFLVAFGSARTQRGLLITDKYGPYVIYEKERANRNTVFVTRERLQDFVDAVAVSG